MLCFFALLYLATETIAETSQNVCVDCCQPGERYCNNTCYQNGGAVTYSWELDWYSYPGSILTCTYNGSDFNLTGDYNGILFETGEQGLDYCECQVVASTTTTTTTTTSSTTTTTLPGMCWSADYKYLYEPNSLQMMKFCYCVRQVYQFNNYNLLADPNPVRAYYYNNTNIIDWSVLFVDGVYNPVETIQCAPFGTWYPLNATYYLPSTTTTSTTSTTTSTTSSTTTSTTTSSTTTSTTTSSITTTSTTSTTTSSSTTTLACAMCWDGSDAYLYPNSYQYKKFCKCAQGTYAYSYYARTSCYKAAAKYSDYYDNLNWATVSVSSVYGPAYKVKCADGVYYPTNKTYYACGSAPTTTTTTHCTSSTTTTSTTTSTTSTTTPSGCSQCWDGSDAYLYPNSYQYKKFCKCAQGTYAYTGYSRTSCYKAAAKYSDYYDNLNWATVSVSSVYGPAYKVKCADGVYYPTNKTYYACGSAPTTTSTSTTTASTTTTTFSGSVKCWRASNKYLDYDSDDIKKFCKCAMGTYAYSSYARVASGYAPCYRYSDDNDNLNWDVSYQSSDYRPVTGVKCPDGVWYSTNEDQYY